MAEQTEPRWLFVLVHRHWIVVSLELNISISIPLYLSSISQTGGGGASGVRVGGGGGKVGEALLLFYSCDVTFGQLLTLFR